MIKVMQYGEGNFLRTFVDYYFDELNVEGGDYGVNIVKPITVRKSVYICFKAEGVFSSTPFKTSFSASNITP